MHVKHIGSIEKRWLLAKAFFARGGNVTGDYGEHLVKQLYGGELLPNSHKSADVRLSDGTLLQVKTRVNKTQW